MARQTALERLMVQQIHGAEKGDLKASEVALQLVDLWGLGPREGTAWLIGYAKVLLGSEALPQMPSGGLSRWHLFGQLRAHDRRGERNWVADLLQDPQVLVDLLSDSELVGQVLPLAVRTLFWCGDLGLALRAIEYLAVQSTGPELELIVDAAITDLLARLEAREDSEDEESTASILGKVMLVDGFERLPAEVRARYHKALAERLLAVSMWDEAAERAAQAAEQAAEHPLLQSSCKAVQALAVLRVHELSDLTPRCERVERDEALALLEHVDAAVAESAPAAAFVRSMLAYETGDHEAAARGFERAIAGMRRHDGRDGEMVDRSRFFLSATLLASGRSEENSRALKLMERALATVQPDLETFYTVHEALKLLDRRLALQFLDAVDVSRGTSPDQLLFIALEYLGLGEGDQAEQAARRVLAVAVDLDQRIEAMQALVTVSNMRGDRQAARACYEDIRELLLQRGAFEQLEKLLTNEDFVGQALDHVEIKVELAALYEEMEGREYERATLMIAIARSLRARKEVESLQQAHALLQEVACSFPDLAREDLAALGKLLELQDAGPVTADAGQRDVQELASRLGRRPNVLVVGGNERQRRHHGKLDQLAADWGFQAEWLETNYTSPQKIVSTIGDRVRSGIDLLVLLHWNRHETTEPALELARKAEVTARTVHYAGFTSLQVALGDLFGKLAENAAGSRR
jgi:tetratricopeptide (TPR) repeat protein